MVHHFDLVYGCGLINFRNMIENVCYLNFHLFFFSIVTKGYQATISAPHMVSGMYM